MHENVLLCMNVYVCVWFQKKTCVNVCINGLQSVSVCACVEADTKTHECYVGTANLI